MDIGKLFSQAWGLFLKDVGPLLVGSLIAGIIPAVAGGIVVVAMGAATFATGTISLEGEVTGVSAAGWALIVIGIVLVVLVSVFLTAPLYAGLIMGVIRRVREGRAMGYGDAFEGFKLFGRVIAVTVFIGLILVGIGLVPSILALTAVGLSSSVLGVLAGLTGAVAFAAMVFLYVRWAYVFPVVVDRGVTATGALRESGAIVGGIGWWTTFLALLVMSLVVGVVSGVLGVIPVIGSIASLFLTPFVLTYVVAMYFQSTGEDPLIAATLQRQPVVPAWPSPPGAYGHPPAAGGAPYQPVPPPPAQSSTPTSVTPGAMESGKWRAPADPAPSPPESADAPAPADPPSAPGVPEAPVAPAAPDDPTT